MEKYIKKNTQIRIARKEDIPLLLALIGEVFQEYDFIYNAFDELPDFFDFDKVYAFTDSHLYVVEDSGKVVACGGYMYDEEKSPVLKRIYVDINQRRKGYGELLVRFLCDEIKELGFPEVSLWTDTRFTKAHRLYEKLGFKVTERKRPLNDVNVSYEIEYLKSFL